MTDNMKVIKQGAEAKLYVCKYLGKPTIIKERFKKNYRHEDLDTQITKERMKNEARAIVRCKTADVKTPCLYLVDFERRRIYMEHFEDSVTVKDFIIDIYKNQTENNTLYTISKMIGQTVRKLHDSNIIHGDLTTSNMLLIERKKSETDDKTKWLNGNNLQIVMIDFGLAQVSSSAEDKGVDLYVLERAMMSTHNDYPDLFNDVLNSYTNCGKNNIKEIISKFEEVRARGRKRTMIG